LKTIKVSYVKKDIYMLKRVDNFTQCGVHKARCDTTSQNFV